MQNMFLIWTHNILSFIFFALDKLVHLHLTFFIGFKVEIHFFSFGTNQCIDIFVVFFFTKLSTRCSLIKCTRWYAIALLETLLQEKSAVNTLIFKGIKIAKYGMENSNSALLLIIMQEADDSAFNSKLMLVLSSTLSRLQWSFAFYIRLFMLSMYNAHISHVKWYILKVSRTLSPADY